MRWLLFDVDGVLLDSLPAYGRAWGRWAAARGIAEEAIWAVAHGRRPIDIVGAVAPHLDAAAEAAAFIALITAEYETVEAMAGAADLLRGLPDRRWAAVTSGFGDMVGAAFDRLGFPSPGVFVGGEDVAVGKPDPACYRLAVARAAARPAECVAIEDAPAGIEAARGAGCGVIAVATTHPPSELTGADRVFGSLGDATSTLRALAASVA